MPSFSNALKVGELPPVPPSQDVLDHSIKELLDWHAKLGCDQKEFVELDCTCGLTTVMFCSECGMVFALQLTRDEPICEHARVVLER